MRTPDDHEIGEQVGGLGGGGPADGSAVLPSEPVLQRRLDQGEGERTPRRTVVGDGRHLDPREPPRGDGRVGHRGGGQDEDRVRAVLRAQPPQPAQHLGHVGAEDAAVAVALVDHHVAQAAQELRPSGVARQHRVMEHVRVGEDEVGVGADPVPLLPRGVTVVGRCPDLADLQPVDRPQLVGGKCLGGGEVERGARAQAVAGVDQRRQHGQQVGQGLTRRGAGGDHRRPPLEGQRGSLRLVRPGECDPGQSEPVDHERGDPARPVGRTRRPGWHVLDVGDVGRARAQRSGQQPRGGPSGGSEEVAHRLC